MLCDLVNSIPEHEPVVVAGDFNDWRCKSHEVLLRKAGLSEVFTSIYGAPPRSFPAALPLLRLDRIFVRSAQFHAALVLPNKPWSRLSDHEPLKAVVTERTRRVYGNRVAG